MKKSKEHQKTVRSLKLNKETLALLASSELQHVAGGDGTTICTTSRTCCPEN